MNGLGCRAEKGREPWPDSLRLCAGSLARPELFEAFCGCWLLLPPSLLSVLSLSSPDRKPCSDPASPPQAGLGKSGTLQGMF